MSNPQWKTITDSLRGRIESGELKPGHRIPSEQDVANTWGVSRNTAHRAIRELQGAGLVVRQRRWGTVVNPQPTVKTGRIAFIFDRAAQNFNFPSWQMISGLQQGLGETYDVICRACKQELTPDTGNSHEEEARLLNKLSLDTDGVVIYPTSHPNNTPLLQTIADTKNLVVLDRIPEGLQTDGVVSDNYDVTYHAIQTLISRGHTRIGFFSFRKPSFSTVADRFRAYEMALADAGITYGNRHVRWFPQELDASPEAMSQAIYDSLFTLVRQSDPITALFCVEDSFAAATLHACEELQIQVPEDLEIATFNDWPPMMLRRPWQTHRIVQNSFGIGLAAGQILARRIAGSKEARSVHKVRAEFYIAGAGLQPDTIPSPNRLK